MMEGKRSAKIFALLTVLGAVKAYDLSPLAVEIYCIVNGVFVLEQSTAPNMPSGTKAIATIQPIEAPGISPLPVVRFKEVLNGLTMRNEVLVPTQLDNETFAFLPFNLTDKDAARNLKDLKIGNLQGQKRCTSIYRRTKQNTFFVSWPDCEHIGQTYDAIIDCTTMTVMVPTGAIEPGKSVPYKFSRQGSKFTLGNAPSNYNCLCAKQRK